MSTVRVEESFELDAPPRVVWSYLIDPAKIVVCLPGAELLSVKDERTYEGRVRVKVGAVTVSYDGTMEFTALDEDERRVEMVGKGREKGGAGTATMTMQGQVEPSTAGDGAGSRISITAEVVLTGKIVRFGRGMIGAVSREVFSQFATCLAGLVTDATADAAGADGPADLPAAPTGPTVAPSATAPASALGLLFATLRSAIKRAVGRLLGRG